jgi:hypothetical protein
MAMMRSMSRRRSRTNRSECCSGICGLDLQVGKETPVLQSLLHRVRRMPYSVNRGVALEAQHTAEHLTIVAVQHLVFFSSSGAGRSLD